MQIFTLHGRKAKRDRKKFLHEIYQNIILPYELSEGYEEEVVGEFENELEERCFRNFISLLKPKAKILDLACGDGRHTLKLSSSVEYVVAFDISSKNLEKAERKCAKEKNISYMKGSMLKLPFRPQTFDGVWFSQAFEYVPPDLREAFLQQLSSILKSDGVLFMSVETWMDANFLTSLSGLLSDLKLFCYWRFLKRKPLIWGNSFTIALLEERWKNSLDGTTTYTQTSTRYGKFWTNTALSLRKLISNGVTFTYLLSKVEIKSPCAFFPVFPEFSRF